MPDFKTLKGTYPRDKDYPERTFNLQALARVLEGTLYDGLEHPFDEEKTEAGEYIKLAQRRPSARTRICRTVVNDSVSLLFSEGHFPVVECTDEGTRDALTVVIAESKLNAVMIEAATLGSVGSAVVLLRVLKGRVFFMAMRTAYLTPQWEEEAPDTLEKVTERYKVKGKVLRDAGYTIHEDKDSEDFWFQRTWDAMAETWFLPQTKESATKGEAPQEDTAKTVTHGLGFVPIAWIRNLPGGDTTDGAPTFPVEAVDTQIEADYLLSQGGRGLKYTADPTLHIKEPAFGEQATVKGAANAIVTSAEGDAKLLEISGEGAAAVMDWVKGLREIALEGAGGNRANADKLSAAQSGRAMELMNQSLIWLADKLRISYGEGAVLELLGMVLRAAAKFPLVTKKGKKLDGLKADQDISLRWPQWYAPTYADKQTQAETLTTLREGGLLSRETGVKSLASSYDIEDPEDEIRQIEKEPPPPNTVAAKPKTEPLSNSED